MRKNLKRILSCVMAAVIMICVFAVANAIGKFENVKAADTMNQAYVNEAQEVNSAATDCLRYNAVNSGAECPYQEECPHREDCPKYENRQNSSNGAGYMNQHRKGACNR